MKIVCVGGKTVIFEGGGRFPVIFCHFAYQIVLFLIYLINVICMLTRWSSTYICFLFWSGKIDPRHPPIYYM